MNFDIWLVSKEELKSPALFKENKKTHINCLKEGLEKESGIAFTIDELSGLILSACRSGEIVDQNTTDEVKVRKESILKWLRKKLIPNTVILNMDDEDLIRLLIFCIEITYQMFEGGTKATVTQKGFRERRRTFEAILADQFTGKLGEIIVRKFFKEKFSIEIELDWEISTQIRKHKNDIINAKKKVSIKTSPTLEGIWAEADQGYDYGIAVKCSVPRHPILQFFIEVCGFLSLLNFAGQKIPNSDKKFQDYLKKIRERVKEYKCGEITTKLKGFVCGYFKTSDYIPVKEGETLPYLGKVREPRYLVKINQLKYTKEDWETFLQETGLKEFSTY
ncbi:MAG: hypothetical protein QXW80_04935 [Candidatus Micrarchaeia archaeon]